MKYIAYFFNGLYTFLGGTTTVIQVISIFTTAFAVSLFAPVVLPIAMGVSVLAGIGVVAFNAFKRSRDKKKIGTLNTQVEELNSEVEALQKTHDQLKHQAKLAEQNLANLEQKYLLLIQEYDLLERLRDIYAEKYLTIPAEKLPEKAREFQQAIGTSLAGLHQLDATEISLEEKLAQISNLNQQLINYLESHNSAQEVQQIKAAMVANATEQAQPAPAIAAKTAASQPSKAAASEAKTLMQTLEPYAKPLSVALKTSLMLFSLCFGIATLGVALFIGPPLAVAATMTTAVLAFSGILLAASLAIGATTAYFSQKYISQEKSQFEQLVKEKAQHEQKKQELLTANKYLSKTNEQLKKSIHSENEKITRTFSLVKNQAQRTEQRLSIPNEPKKSFSLSAQQSLDILNLRCTNGDKLKQAKGITLGQDELLKTFNQLTPAQKQTLIDKWRKEGIEELPTLPELKNH